MVREQKVLQPRFAVRVPSGQRLSLLRRSDLARGFDGHGRRRHE